MNRSSRRLPFTSLKWAVIVILLLVISYGVYAVWVLTQLQDAAQQWMADAQTRGWTVKHDDATPNLFFDHATIRMAHVEADGPKGKWTSESVGIARYFLDPGHMKLVITGGNTVQVGAGQWRFAAFPLRIDMRVSPHSGQIKTLHATGNDIQIVNGDQSATFAQALGLSLTPGGEADKPGTDFIATAAGLIFKPAQGDALPPITMAEAQGKLRGTLPAAMPVAALGAWNSDGGTIELERFVLEWPPLKLEGNGTVALDPQLQPVAALAARIQGLARLADTLQQAGGTNDGNWDGLRNAAKAQTPIPVTLQNGKVWIGDTAIADQPQLHWPQE